MHAAQWGVDQTRILARSEIATVLAELKRKAPRAVNTRQNQVIFRLATCCGLRVSELCGLNVGDVRVGIRRPYLRIPKSIAKGKQPRRVPLWWDAGTLTDLTAWRVERIDQGAKPGDPFVCSQGKSTPGKRLDRRNARQHYIRACRILGPQRQREITTHVGRHSFVSHALAGGRSLAEVQRAAGHRSLATTAVYLHIAVDDDGTVGDLFAFNGKGQ